MFKQTKRFISSMLVSTMFLSALPSVVPTVNAADTASITVETPKASVSGGRYDEVQTITLSTATPGAEIFYTLDGMTPDDKSLKYDNKPIVISKTGNLSVIAKKDSVYSKAYTYGYIIKTKEKPLLQFVAMSDVHTSTYGAEAKYATFFDTIGSIFPRPDAIVLNGDLINDNGEHSGDNHKIVQKLFQDNLIRKGMDTTKVQVAIGNHDDTVAKVKEGYPGWFTDQPNGYYETQIGGYFFFFLNGNNYNSDTAQRNWLKGRLAAITSDPVNKNKPIFVNIHHPISNTIMDGQQATNPNLYTDLKDYPQVVTFSGHSHLNINDDRSIYQKDFTSVNTGSMSYIEVEHGYLAVTPSGLVSRFEFPVAQADFVEVYANRVEVDRVSLNADFGDIYAGGKWSFNPQPPFNSAGAIAGATWDFALKGSTNEEIKSNFKYTTANRNKVAPFFNSNARLTVTDLNGVPQLSFPQAKDDQMVHHYEVAITDLRSGQIFKSFNVFSDFYFAPVPNTMRFPLDGLQAQTKYDLKVTAVDSYENKSGTLRETFTVGGTAPELTPIDPQTMWKQLVVDMNFDDNLNDRADGVTGLATAKGSVVYAPGKLNQAVSIPSGTANYVDLGNRSDLKFGSGDFTVSFWHTGSLKADQTVISNKDWNSGKNVGWYIGPASANGMTINLGNGTSRLDTSASGVGSEWHLFTITVDRAGNVGKVYVDGVEKSTAAVPALGTSSMDTPYNIIIGADGKKGYAGSSVTMDELKIWKRALSATEVKALSDSYKAVKPFTFEQLTAWIAQSETFQKQAGSITGVTYPADLLTQLRDQLAAAKLLTGVSSPDDIDKRCLDLQWTLKTVQAAAIYSFIPKADFGVVAYSSYADNENAVASNLLDGNQATIWHSKYVSPAANPPHWVIFDAQKTQRITGIRRTSRLSQTAQEFPKEFTLYASDNVADLSDETYLDNEQNKAAGVFGKTWNGATYQDFVALSKPIEGRYIKFVVNGTYQPTAVFTSMSEIDFTGNVVLPSSNADLLDLKVNGKTVPGLSANELNYTVLVPYTTTVAEVTYKPADVKASAVLTGNPKLIVGSNTFRIDVKAQDNTAKQYTVTVKRADVPEGGSSGSAPSSSTPPAEVVPTTPPAETKPAQPEPQPKPQPQPNGKTPVNLSDIGGHWAQDSIQRAITLGIVQGYENDTFQPGEAVTRAEFAVMLARALKLGGNAKPLQFTDADNIGKWAEREIALLIDAGIINGYDDGSFQPGKRLTRAEMIVLLMRAAGLTPQGEAASFSDQASIPAWAAGAVALAQQKGVIDGLPGNRFAPADSTNRAEAAVVLLRMLDKLKPGM